MKRFLTLSITAMLAVAQTLPAMARPDQPIMCDGLQIFTKTCRPPNLVAGAWPRCFCSVSRALVPRHVPTRPHCPPLCPDGSRPVGLACLCLQLPQG